MENTLKTERISILCFYSIWGDTIRKEKKKEIEGRKKGRKDGKEKRRERWKKEERKKNCYRDNEIN